MLEVRTAALLLLMACGKAMSAAAGFEVIHSFEGQDGSCPMRELVRGTDGSWYGTTSQGGQFGGGTLFRLEPSGQVAVVHSFDPSHESRGPNGLHLGRDGLLYGSTYGDFGGDPGSVFVLTRSGRVRTIATFTDGRGAGPITQSRDGTLYGTLVTGGTYGDGYVYSMTPQGTISLLHSFGGDTGSVATTPLGKLVEGPDGAFYGTTNGGGSYGLGALYRITSDGQYSNLHSFGGQGRLDGQQPWDGVDLGNDSMLYGTTAYGGANGNGVVFRVTTSGANYTVVSDFSGEPAGRWPYSAPLALRNSILVGATGSGGANQLGSIYMVAGQKTTILHSFAADGSEGQTYPYARLVRDSNGDFLGSACQGGAFGAGTLFRVRLAVGL